jgi:hypothetical protein
VAGVGVLLAGCLPLVGCQRSGQPGAEAATSTPVAGGAAGTGRPVSLLIPAVGVDARVVPVGLRGNRIVVGLDGGAARAFLAERVERRSKDDLPVERIWNRANRPVLRLITCGGSFDRATGHYRDNLIVYAAATT